MGKYALFYYRNMLHIYQNMLLFLKTTKICTYMPKISKKEHIYPISDYDVFVPLLFGELALRVEASFVAFLFSEFDVSVLLACELCLDSVFFTDSDVFVPLLFGELAVRIEASFVAFLFWEFDVRVGGLVLFLLKKAKYVPAIIIIISKVPIITAAIMDAILFFGWLVVGILLIVVYEP